eukprot:368285-Rhodomonas_salina.2
MFGNQMMQAWMEGEDGRRGEAEKRADGAHVTDDGKALPGLASHLRAPSKTVASVSCARSWVFWFFWFVGGGGRVGVEEGGMLVEVWSMRVDARRCCSMILDGS